MPARKAAIKEKDLRNWKFIADFEEILERVFSKADLNPTFSDAKRKLSYSRYLSLFLFGLFNPVVNSMRGLVEASHLPKVQREVCDKSTSLGSFSETQAVLDPELLHEVFTELASRMPDLAPGDARLRKLDLVAQDGSLWQALPRMAWAQYGVGPTGAAKGVRLHLRFHLHKEAPVDARVDVGKSSERKALREMLKEGQTNVGDRLYGADYRLFGEIDQAGAFFVFRIKEGSVIHVDEELAITEADRTANVVRHAWVYLGATEKLRSMRVRLVEIRSSDQHLFLVTNLPVNSAPAELVGMIYRRRWAIELFFRWIKCILGCRRFLAESPQGVAIQLYLALIAALLLQLWTGKRPNIRAMELIQWYLTGMASAEDVARLMPRHTRPKIKKA